MTVVLWPPSRPDDFHRFYPPGWTEFALCAEVDPDLFSPEKGGNARLAREIFAACPVQSQCLDYAMGRDDFGVWGGLTERERRALKRNTRRKAA